MSSDIPSSTLNLTRIMFSQSRQQARSSPKNNYEKWLRKNRYFGLPHVTVEKIVLGLASLACVFVIWRLSEHYIFYDNPEFRDQFSEYMHLKQTDPLLVQLVRRHVFHPPLPVEYNLQWTFDLVSEGEHPKLDMAARIMSESDVGDEAESENNAATTTKETPNEGSDEGGDEEEAQYLQGLEKTLARNNISNPVSTFVLRMFSYKRNGIFIDLGATANDRNSASLPLEYGYGWTGLVQQSNEAIHRQLRRKNRRVWLTNTCLSRSKRLTRVPIQKLPSPLKSFHNGENEKADKETRGYHDDYRMCVPLYTMLLALDMETVDYLNVDLGPETVPVMSTLPLESFDVKVISVEFRKSERSGKSFKQLASYLRSKEYTYIKEFTNPFGNLVMFWVHPSMIKFTVLLFDLDYL